MKNFLLLIVWLCCYTVCNAGAEGSANSLRILSYNIKFLPRIIKSQHHHPIIRAHIIPSFIKEENPDIVVFQEAFDPKGDRILRKALKKNYPYMIGPVNKKPGFKINGGVLIMSKYPIKQIATVQYSKCTDFDCWARKGVLLVEVNDGQRIYQIAGTHMNGGGSLELKTTQYQEMGALVKQYAKPGVPQFLVGDYNTSNFDKPFYNSMITQLDAEDGPITGLLQCTNDHLNNDMEPYFDIKERDIIDYILYRPNGLRPTVMTRTIHSYCNNWGKGHYDLSDHYALLMELKW
jgi:exonuclease III